MDHEAYRIDSEITFNNILQKNDLRLAPLRKGNFMMPIVSFADDKELLEKSLLIDQNLWLETKFTIKIKTTP